MAVVLKSDSKGDKSSAAREVAGLAGFNLSDLADEGRTRLEECRRQIRAMLDEAKQQAQSLAVEAEKRGYEEGLLRAAEDADRKLKEEADRRAKTGMQVIQQAVEQLHRIHEDWMQQYAQSLNSIALAAAERIVKRRLKDEPELLVQWAGEALRSTRAANSLVLAVHPEVVAQLGQSFDTLLASSDLPEQTHVEPDESLSPDEVVVRQNGGEIEAGLRAQLQRLEELLS